MSQWHTVVSVVNTFIKESVSNIAKENLKNRRSNNRFLFRKQRLILEIANADMMYLLYGYQVIKVVNLDDVETYLSNRKTMTRNQGFAVKGTTALVTPIQNLDCL